MARPSGAGNPKRRNDEELSLPSSVAQNNNYVPSNSPVVAVTVNFQEEYGEDQFRL